MYLMSVFLHNSDPTGGRVQMKRLNYKRAAAFLMGCLLAVNTGLGGFSGPIGGIASLAYTERSTMSAC